MYKKYLPIALKVGKSNPSIYKMNYTNSMNQEKLNIILQHAKETEAKIAKIKAQQPDQTSLTPVKNHMNQILALQINRRLKRQKNGRTRVNAFKTSQLPQTI